MAVQKQGLEKACKRYEEDLVLYYYGDVAAEDQRRLDDHLSDCVACRRFLEDLRRLLPAMATPEELPDPFWHDYYREMVAKLRAQQEQRSWWRELLEPIRSWAVPAFGTAAVVVFGIGLTFSNGLWNRGGQRQDAIPQEILSDENKLEFFKSMHLVELLSQLEAQEGAKSDAGNSHSL